MADFVDRQEERAAEPAPSRPFMPDGYGVPESEAGMLAWDYAREQLAKARNYWIGTVRPDGRPHVTPVWGVWLDDTLYFGTAPETRRGRNIAANPAVVVHLESGDEVIIVEGDARELQDVPRSLATRLAEGTAAKYKDYQPAPEEFENGGVYALRPSVAFAWTKFPADVTRWRFET